MRVGHEPGTSRCVASSSYFGMLLLGGKPQFYGNRLVTYQRRGRCIRGATPVAAFDDLAALADIWVVANWAGCIAS
jgi:hypothetical protein